MGKQLEPPPPPSDGTSPVSIEAGGGICKEVIWLLDW